MNPFLEFVSDIKAGVSAVSQVTVEGQRMVQTSDSKVLLFMPHPDDECIIGLLPLRLMQEAGMQIINIPVTFGSDPDRQAEREKELTDACGYLGWELHKEQEGTRSLEVSDVVAVLTKFQPDVIFFPHDQDWNSRHISTHHLVMDGLSQMPEDFRCRLVETEFWGAMEDPNLMVEGSCEQVADLVAATSLHVEEVARNPYHLRLPAWMQDNVRRGGELIGGQGQAAPEFSFATLYRLREWRNREVKDVFVFGMSIPLDIENLKEIMF